MREDRSRAVAVRDKDDSAADSLVASAGQRGELLELHQWRGGWPLWGYVAAALGLLLAAFVLGYAAGYWTGYRKSPRRVSPPPSAGPESGRAAVPFNEGFEHTPPVNGAPSRRTRSWRTRH